MAVFMRIGLIATQFFFWNTGTLVPCVTPGFDYIR